MSPKPLSERWGGKVQVLRAIALVLGAILLLPYLIAPLYRFVDPVSTVILWRRLTGQRVERIVVPLDRIAPSLPLAVTVAEDGHFCVHHGIDWGELRQAVRTADAGGALRGASTITQQTAKNLFLWESRSFVRKALEFPLALWIDLVLPKRRIMEIYLDIAEWGPNGEFGAEAAARHAFGKSASDLTLREAVLLATVLPNPKLRDARRPGSAMRRLAGIYEGRALRSPGLDACVGRPLPAGRGP